jgi:hypothetical protein
MRRKNNPWVLIGLVGVLLGSLASPGIAPAETAPDPASAPQGGGVACGFALSAPVYDAWQGLDGESGRLGCATARESNSSSSPQGSGARVAVFGQNGEIILHLSGPHAGQAYAVSACFYRLYVQFGGTGGWLGLPLGDAENTPDGSRQKFEGGSMKYGRAFNQCEATPAEAPAQPPAAIPAEAQTPLDVFENPTTGDRLSLASGGSVAQAEAAGYQKLRGQARVLAEARPGATRLKLYENEARGLYVVLAAPQSESDALADGFVFEAGQGYVWTDPRPGTVALKQYRDQATGRTRLTAGEIDESEAAAKGYAFVRIEGYATPAS